MLRVIRLLLPHRTRLRHSLANPHLLLTLSRNSRATGTMVALVILETSTAKAMTVGVDQLTQLLLITVVLTKKGQLHCADISSLL